MMLVPAAVKIMLDFLETHGLSTQGLFRISADPDDVADLTSQLTKLHNEQVTMIQDRQVAPPEDMSSMVVPFLDTTNRKNVSDLVHTVASVLKTFLKKLPAPLLHSPLQDYLLKQSDRFLVNDSIHEDKIANRLQWCGVVSNAIDGPFAQLAPAEQTILKMILRLLHLVKANADTNKMTSKNLAIVFAPTLFPNSISIDAFPLGKSVPKLPAGGMTMGLTAGINNLETSISCVEGLVDHFEELYGCYVGKEGEVDINAAGKAGDDKMESLGRKELEASLSEVLRRNMDLEAKLKHLKVKFNTCEIDLKKYKQLQGVKDASAGFADLHPLTPVAVGVSNPLYHNEMVPPSHDLTHKQRFPSSKNVFDQLKAEQLGQFSSNGENSNPSVSSSNKSLDRAFLDGQTHKKKKDRRKSKLGFGIFSKKSKRIGGDDILDDILSLDEICELAE